MIDRNKTKIKSVKLKSLSKSDINEEVIKFSKENGNIELFDVQINLECVIETRIGDYTDNKSLGCLFG